MLAFYYENNFFFINFHNERTLYKMKIKYKNVFNKIKIKIKNEYSISIKYIMIKCITLHLKCNIYLKVYIKILIYTNK